MMSHQAGDAITSPDPTQKAGTIDRMKPRIGHSRSIPNVVQPRRRYQNTIGQTKSLSNMLRPVPNALDMLPPPRQFGQAPLGESPRVSGRYHSSKPTRNIKEDITRRRTCRAECMPGRGDVKHQMKPMWAISRSRTPGSPSSIYRDSTPGSPGGSPAVPPACPGDW
jgi:hypothetical protein